MQNGTRGNRGGGLVQVVGRGQETLRPGIEYMVTGVVDLWLPPTAPPDRAIVANNATTGSLLVSSAGDTKISGVRVSNGAAISAVNKVRILPGGRAVFVANNGNWIAQGIELAPLTFTYNGTPLSSNTSNPLSASDLFHYLGIVQGSGTWVNPANTTQLVSAASGMGGGTVASLTDRVASGQNVFTTDVAGSWIGWQFPYPFRCTGFWFQTKLDNQFPRNFALWVNTGTSLTTGQSLSGWTEVQSWTNRTEVNAANAYFFYSTSTPATGNQLTLVGKGLNSSGLNALGIQEVNLFGDYLP